MITQYMQQTPVVFGEGAMETVGKHVKALGCHKVLCIYGHSVRGAGISKRAVDAIVAEGLDCVVFEDILADPPDYLMDEIAQTARAEQVDCIVGIGGGSAMDTAKAVSILMKHPSPMRNYLNLEGPPFTVDSGVPTVLIPTSAGTGSEVTKICVITHTEANMKIPVFTNCALAIVDPALCVTAPASITANSGFDALAHAMEAVTCANRNPLSETLALAAIRRIATYLPIACSDGENMQARCELSLAANFAGIAFNASDVQIGHAAADAISAACHTPHGLNCAWVNAPVQELMARAVPDKVKLVGEALGVVFDGSETDIAIGEKTGDAIRALMRACHLPTMAEKGFARDVLAGGDKYICANVLNYNCPLQVTEPMAAALLQSAYDGTHYAI